MDHSLKWNAAVRTTNLIQNNDSQNISVSFILVVNTQMDLGLKKKKIEENVIGFWKWFMKFEITYFICTGLTFQTASSGLQMRLNPARLGSTEKLTLNIFLV